MTTRDLLGVAVRAIGVWFFVEGLDDFVVGLMRAAGLPFFTHYTWLEDFDVAVSFACVGLLVFVAADKVVLIAFDRVRGDH